LLQRADVGYWRNDGIDGFPSQWETTVA
jgi:hypothetical protein